MKLGQDEKLAQRREQYKITADFTRLQILYLQDYEKYENELKAQESTQESRIEKMRSRVIELREKREKDRLEEVEKKLNEQWIRGCNDIRHNAFLF